MPNTTRTPRRQNSNHILQCLGYYLCCFSFKNNATTTEARPSRVVSTNPVSAAAYDSHRYVEGVLRQRGYRDGEGRRARSAPHGSSAVVDVPPPSLPVQSGSEGEWPRLQRVRVGQRPLQVPARGGAGDGVLPSGSAFANVAAARVSARTNRTLPAITYHKENLKFAEWLIYDCVREGVTLNESITIHICSMIASYAMELKKSERPIALKRFCDNYFTETDMIFGFDHSKEPTLIKRLQYGVERTLSQHKEEKDNWYYYILRYAVQNTVTEEKIKEEILSYYSRVESRANKEYLEGAKITLLEILVEEAKGINDRSTVEEIKKSLLRRNNRVLGSPAIGYRALAITRDKEDEFYRYLAEGLNETHSKYKKPEDSAFFALLNARVKLGTAKSDALALYASRTLQEYKRQQQRQRRSSVPFSSLEGAGAMPSVSQAYRLH